MVQFLEGLDAAAAASLTLRRVDHLPRLVVFLFLTIAHFGEIEDNGEQHG